MRFEMKQLGDLRREAERNRVDFADALWVATSDVSKSLQRLLRQDLERSGIARAAQMAKTWRAVVKPKASKLLAAGQTPKAYVFNRSPVFGRYFETGGIARPRRAKALLVPVGRARKVRLPIGTSRTALLRAVEAKFGKLTPIKMRDGRLMLALVSTTRAGKSRMEPMFVLTTQVRIPQLVTPERIYDRFIEKTDRIWVALVASRFDAIARKRADGTQVTTARDRAEARSNMSGMTVAAAAQGLQR